VVSDYLRLLRLHTKPCNPARPAPRSRIVDASGVEVTVLAMSPDVILLAPICKLIRSVREYGVVKPKSTEQLLSIETGPNGWPGMIQVTPLIAPSVKKVSDRLAHCCAVMLPVPAAMLPLIMLDMVALPADGSV
jgi:hypothetical protein